MSTLVMANDIMAAHIARGRLEAEGIPAVLCMAAITGIAGLRSLILNRWRAN